MRAGLRLGKRHGPAQQVKGFMSHFLADQVQQGIPTLSHLVHSVLATTPMPVR